MTWFSCVSKFNLNDSVRDVECLHLISNIVSVRSRNDITNFDGIEILLKDGNRVFTETYDIAEFLSVIK